MGPSALYLGKDVPKEAFSWQDPLPKPGRVMVGPADVSQLKSQILGAGLQPRELIKAAWASASTYRGTDMRGGANGARIRLAPAKDWVVNDPAELARVLGKLEAIQKKFNASAAGGKQVSLADLIVLGGNAAIEQAAQKAGHDVTVPFTAGRVDASQSQTDVASFEHLRPHADGFRNFYGTDSHLPPAQMLVDKANMLGLTVPEMTVLVGGMRALDANAGHSAHGVFTDRPGTLNNDFFVNLLDMSTEWKKSPRMDGLYEGFDRASGKLRWTATPVDLVFGSNSELRAVSEAYGSYDSGDLFVNDFIAAWAKVMNLDRF